MNPHDNGAHRRIRERFLRPAPYALPERLRGVRVERGFPEPLIWPVYDVSPADAAARSAGPVPVVMYVHGGGWVNEMASQHWSLIARITRETGQRVIVPVHPLLPSGRARAVRDGVVALVHAELDAGHEVWLAGDSSGGQIILSAALRLRDEGIAVPATTLLSLAVDLTWDNPQIPAVEPLDPWPGRPGAHCWPRRVRAKTTSATPLSARCSATSPASAR